MKGKNIVRLIVTHLPTEWFVPHYYGYDQQMKGEGR